MVLCAIKFKDFFLNKIFLGPRRSNIRNFCCNCPWPTKFLGKYLFGTTRPPVYVQKWPNMLFSALFGCPVEKLPQSTGLPWKTLTPKILPNFVLLFHKYCHYAISFWDFKTHRDGHNHGSRHRSPEFFFFKI